MTEDSGVWRHKKRGTTYDIVGKGELQNSTDLLCDGMEMIVYRSREDSRLWVRAGHEFHDGRFERIEPLCNDEGCDHFGTPHVCISTPRDSGFVRVEHHLEAITMQAKLIEKLSLALKSYSCDCGPRECKSGSTTARSCGFIAQNALAGVSK